MTNLTKKWHSILLILQQKATDYNYLNRFQLYFNFIVNYVNLDYTNHSKNKKKRNENK